MWVVFNDMGKEELLRIAACLEEHFPHSMAKAVVNEAVKRGLVHKEMHSRVDYIVAHGIATYVGDERVVIGSYHLCLKMRDAGYRRIRERYLTAFPWNIPTSTWPSEEAWQPLSALRTSEG